MVTTPILVFPDWTKEFHVLVDASSIALGVVLVQPSEGDINHLIAFARMNLSYGVRNYTTTEREGLVMVYALQKFYHYLLGGHFKMFTDHFALTYLVNKPALGGKLCHLLLLFKEFDFEIIMKPGHLNAGLDHFSWIKTGKEPTNIKDRLLDAQLFKVGMVDDHYEKIIQFFSTRKAPDVPPQVRRINWLFEM